MPGYFPKIYDDELLASAVARYHCHTMGFSHEVTHKELYGSNHRRTSINFPRDLQALVANIGPFIGKDAYDLVADTTMFPYYFAFETEETRKRITMNMIQSGYSKGGAIAARRDRAFDGLRACPDCIKADLEKYGEAYWHRTHQIDAVHVCPRHTTPLLKAKTRYFESQAFPLEILTQTTPLSKYLPALSERCRQRFSEIAAYADEYLKGASPTARTLPSNVEEKAELRKFYPFRNIGLHMLRIEKDIIEHFGEQCLELLGLTIFPGHKSSWVRGMFQVPMPPMPTKHIIMKIFMNDFVRNRITQIENAQDIVDKLSARTWPCSNPAADHFGKQVVMNVYKSKSYSQNNLIGFRCDCGYIYLAEEKGLEHGGAPIVKSVLTFGPIFVEKVRSLHAQDMNYSQIGRTLGVDSDTVKSMLSENYRARKCSTSAEANAARMAKIQEKRKLTSKEHVFVDYNARDEQFVQRVRKAADLLYGELPPVRASRYKIVITSGIKGKQLIRHQSYPKTIAALTANVRNSGGVQSASR